MSSPERELLRKISRKTHCINYDEINELLAQPEKDLEVLKKDWVNFGRTAGRKEGYDQGFNDGKYLSSPKREALSQVVDSDETASTYLDARLWEFIDMSACFPKAKPDLRIWDHVLIYAPKPEQTKQEPVAWRYKTPLYNTYSEENYHELEGEPLAREMYQRGYAKAELDLTREPLGKEIKVPCGTTEYMFGFKDGVLYAEKEHGIGVK